MTRSTLRALCLVAGVAAASGGVLFDARGTANAASPAATPGSSVSVTAEPMLGGTFGAGSWAAVRTTVENRGPALEGELTLSAPGQRGSRFSLALHLPTGARQEHFLYGRATLFNSRFEVTFESGPVVHARADVAVQGQNAASLGVYVVAERPQALVGTLSDAASSGGPPPAIVNIEPADLPPRVEPWSSIDLLVWQDVDSKHLNGDQLKALSTWVSIGGDLVILGGTTGTTTLSGFPPELLPYRPTDVTEVAVSDLQALLGELPANAAPVAAVTGPLERGVALAQAGEAVVAARTAYGRGSVSIIGLDPSAAWMAESPALNVLWARFLPSVPGADAATVATDGGFLVDALSELPAVQIPRLGHVFLLIIAYIVAIGPVNYLLLRRRDRREWAWLTMPATILVFAVAAYGFGVALKGASVIVNELAVVYGATASDRGVAEVHVGVYSPSRNSFDVKVDGDVLVSAVATNGFGERNERPVDVLLGDPATLRNYGVGFGALRAFRAEAAVGTPRVNSDLKVVEGVLEGTVTNASDVQLSEVTVVYGDAFESLGDIAAGESRRVSVSTARQGQLGEPMSWRLFPSTGGDDAASVRTLGARRAIIQSLAGGWEEGMTGAAGGVFGSGPVILAWQSGATLEIDVGMPAEHVGERLFVLPAPVTLTGPVVFSRGLIQSSTVSIDAADGHDEREWYSLSRGTVVVDYRPAGFEGSLAVSELTFRLGTDSPAHPVGDGNEVKPLPAAEQPDPEAPLASDPRPDGGSSDVPRVQLFDRRAGTWIEFEPVEQFTTYRISDPGRYVDESGAFRVRFVMRGSDYAQFSFAPRIEGTVE